MVNIIRYFKTQLIIKIICSLFLIYQTVLILEQYMNFNSVINIKFTPNVINSLPAITICYNRIYSFGKLVERYPEYKQEYENYFNYTNELYMESYTGNENSSTEVIEKNQFYLQLYNNILNNHGLNSQTILNQYVSLHDFFDNLTLTYEDSSLIFSGNDNKSITIKLHGDAKNIPGQPNKDNYISDSFAFNLRPIESIKFLTGFKCFTFFDEKQIPFSLNIVNLKHIHIQVRFPISWFPFDSKIGISYALHSPNVIPTDNSFKKLKQNHAYIAYYSKLEDIRLESYDDCEDRGDIDNYNITRDNCLDQCMLSFMGFECFKIYILLNKRISLRRDQLPDRINLNPENLRNCPEFFSTVENSKFCYLKCKEDCYQAHYFVDVEEYRTYFDPISRTNRYTTFDLYPNSRPNIIIEHFAETTFISLFCNFGGLIGMYLGISIQSVSYDIWQLIKNIFIKYIFIKMSNRFSHRIMIFNKRPNNIVINLS